MAYMRVETPLFGALGLNQNLASRICFYGASGLIVYEAKKKFAAQTKGEKKESWLRMPGFFKYFKRTVTVVSAVPESAVVIQESVRAGSVETEQMRKNFSVLVGFKKGSEFHAVGNGLRIENFFVCPEHVVAAICAATGQDVEFWVKGKQGLLCLKVAELETLATDLTGMRLTDMQFSNLGLPVTSIHRKIAASGEKVTIHGISTKGTTGVLKTSPHFGYVTYSGTTCGGYSGGVYCVGNQVAGIHLSGGTVNEGLSASYVHSCIKMHTGSVPEDSAAFMDGIKGSGKKVRLGLIRDGYAQIEVDGEYHVVSAEKMTKHFGHDWFDNMDRITKRIPESQDFRNAGGSSKSKPADQLSHPENAASTSEQPTLSAAQLKMVNRVNTLIAQNKVSTESGKLVMSQ